MNNIDRCYGVSVFSCIWRVCPRVVHDSLCMWKRVLKGCSSHKQEKYVHSLVYHLLFALLVVSLYILFVLRSVECDAWLRGVRQSCSAQQQQQCGHTLMRPSNKVHCRVYIVGAVYLIWKGKHWAWWQMRHSWLTGFKGVWCSNRRNTQKIKVTMHVFEWTSL